MGCVQSSDHAAFRCRGVEFKVRHDVDWGSLLVVRYDRSGCK